jgi:5-methylcytosine-specific restriction endonuclease McrA
MPYKNIEDRQAAQRKRYAERRAGDTLKPPIRRADPLHCDNPACGKAFYRSPANRRTDANYCSRACMAAVYVGRNVADKSPRWKGRDTRPCENCGHPVVRPHWEVDDGMTFCNRACFGQWKARNWTGEDNPCWRGGHPPYYGANWKRQQREARHRDQHQCQLCGIAESECRRALDVHHIVPFRLFGVNRYRDANALHNLVSLCDSCHAYAERLSQSGVIKDWPTLQQAVLPLFRASQTT